MKCACSTPSYMERVVFLLSTTCLVSNVVYAYDSGNRRFMGHLSVEAILFSSLQIATNKKVTDGHIEGNFFSFWTMPGDSLFYLYFDEPLVSSSLCTTHSLEGCLPFFCLYVDQRFVSFLLCATHSLEGCLSFSPLFR